MGDLSRKITVLGVEYGVRVCAQYSIACYYTEPYVVGVVHTYYVCVQYNSKLYTDHIHATHRNTVGPNLHLDR